MPRRRSSRSRFISAVFILFSPNCVRLEAGNAVCMRWLRPLHNCSSICGYGLCSLTRIKKWEAWCGRAYGHANNSTAPAPDDPSRPCIVADTGKLLCQCPPKRGQLRVSPCRRQSLPVYPADQGQAIESVVPVRAATRTGSIRGGCAAWIYRPAPPMSAGTLRPNAGT